MVAPQPNAVDLFAGVPLPAGVAIDALGYLRDATTPDAGPYEFGASATPSEPVVGPTNNPPVADAGPDQGVSKNSLVTLDATGSSDPDLDPLTYAWSQLSGPAATLSDPSAAQPTFTAGVAGSLVFQVQVSDGTDTDTDTVTITVSNAAPVANAGPDQGVAVGAQVTLDGSGSSDPDTDPLTYAWSQLSGPSVTLSDPSSAQPTFTPSEVGAIVMQLEVDDGAATSADTVTITVSESVPGNRLHNYNASLFATGLSGIGARVAR